MKSKKWLPALIVASLAVGAGVAVAQDIVATRQGEMKDFGKKMGAIKAVLVDKKGTMADVVAAADYLAHDSTEIVEWFPKGSDTGKTEALPVIWEKPDDFAKAAKHMGELATALSAAAAKDDAAASLAAFGALGKEGCGGCHTTFRKPQS